MTHYLATHGDHIAAAFLGLVALVLAVWSLLKLGRELDTWADRRVDHMVRGWALDEAAETFGPRLMFGDLDLTGDESVAYVLGWDDPFAITRAQIAALPTREIA